jgi:hypothetical protein
MTIPGMVVPKLVGETLDVARGMVIPNGANSEDRLFLDPVVDSGAPSRDDEGIILRQYPEPGLEIPRGTAIRVWLYGDYVPPPPPDPPSTGAGTPSAGAAGAGFSGAAGGGSTDQGLPYLDIPGTLAGQPLGYASACNAVAGGSAYDVKAPDLPGRGGRFARPSGGFQCVGANGAARRRTVTTRYGAGANHITVNFYWMEPGDTGPRKYGYNDVSTFCNGAASWDSILGMPGYTGVYNSPLAHVGALVSVGSQGERVVAAVEAYLRDAFARIQPYAISCR